MSVKASWVQLQGPTSDFDGGCQCSGVGGQVRPVTHIVCRDGSRKQSNQHIVTSEDHSTPSGRDVHMPWA